MKNDILRQGKDIYIQVPTVKPINMVQNKQHKKPDQDKLIGSNNSVQHQISEVTTQI